MGKGMQSCQSQRNVWKRHSRIKAFDDSPLTPGSTKELRKSALQAARLHQAKRHGRGHLMGLISLSTSPAPLLSLRKMSLSAEEVQVPCITSTLGISLLRPVHEAPSVTWYQNLEAVLCSLKSLRTW